MPYLIHHPRMPSLHFLSSIDLNTPVPVKAITTFHYSFFTRHHFTDEHYIPFERSCKGDTSIYALRHGVENPWEICITGDYLSLYVPPGVYYLPVFRTSSVPEWMAPLRPAICCLAWVCSSRLLLSPPSAAFCQHSISEAKSVVIASDWCIHKLMLSFTTQPSMVRRGWLGLWD